MLIRLSDHWHEYLLHTRRRGVPTTNDFTEHAIGRFKVRTKTMRGIKSEAGRNAIFTPCNASLVA